MLRPSRFLAAFAVLAMCGLVVGLAGCATTAATTAAIVSVREVAKLVSIDADGHISLNGPAVQAKIQSFTALSPEAQCQAYFAIKHVVSEHAPQAGRAYVDQAAAVIESQNFSCGVAPSGEPIPEPGTVPVQVATQGIPIEVGD